MKRNIYVLSILVIACLLIPVAPLLAGLVTGNMTVDNSFALYVSTDDSLLGDYIVVPEKVIFTRSRIYNVAAFF